MNATDPLRFGVSELGVALSANAEERMQAYLSLLAKWNRTYNLTAVREETAMVGRHLLDSLAVLPYLDRHAVRSLADVGSGGGLPGIPLAIARSELPVTLIEASHKKASFLQQAKIELEISNVSIHCGRVEDFRPAERYDAIISRAFASLADYVQLAAHLLGRGGKLLAMKGVLPNEEIAEVPDHWKVSQCIDLAVPGVQEQRLLIVVEQA